MVTPTPDFYCIQLQAAPPLLRGTTLRPLTVQEVTPASELLLAEAQQAKCPYWLLDCRADRARQQHELYYWLEEDYLPRVRATLGRAPIVAFLALPAMWQQLQAQGNAVPAPTLLSAAFRLEWFTEEAAAHAWIDQFRLPLAP